MSPPICARAPFASPPPFDCSKIRNYIFRRRFIDPTALPFPRTQAAMSPSICARAPRRRHRRPPCHLQFLFRVLYGAGWPRQRLFRSRSFFPSICPIQTTSRTCHGHSSSTIELPATCCKTPSLKPTVPHTSKHQNCLFRLRFIVFTCRYIKLSTVDCCPHILSFLLWVSQRSFGTSTTKI